MVVWGRTFWDNPMSRCPPIQLFSCRQLPWRTPMVLLCSSVSSHSAAFRVEAVACLGPACLVSKEGDLFPTTPAGYKPNVKPQWNDKNWLPIFFPGMLFFVEHLWSCNIPFLADRSNQSNSTVTQRHPRAVRSRVESNACDRYVSQYQKYWHRRC